MTVMKHLVLGFIAFFAFVAPAFAAQTQPVPQPQQQQPQAAAEAPKPKGALPEVALVEVRKRQRRMFLLDADNNVIRSYHVSLGRNPVGHKEQEGDSRTPEGKYTIDSKNGRSGYYRSLHISYPNKDDIARAKKKGVSPGGAIFIHGKPDFKFWMFWKYNKMNDWTDGCIAVDDKNMMEMWGIIKEGTPIIIKP